MSMLLFLLCANVRPAGVSVANPAPFSDPSADLLDPWKAGEQSNVGLAAVSPVCCAFAATVSSRGAFDRLFASRH